MGGEYSWSDMTEILEEGGSGLDWWSIVGMIGIRVEGGCRLKVRVGARKL